MLSPTKKRCPLRNSHQFSSRSRPLVCKSFSMRLPPACRCCNLATLRKKSSPNNVGSPPCQVKTTVSSSWPAMYCRTNSSRSSSGHAVGSHGAEQVGFGEVIAIGAVQVAPRPNGLGHEVKGTDQTCRTRCERWTVHGTASILKRPEDTGHNRLPATAHVRGRGRRGFRHALSLVQLRRHVNEKVTQSAAYLRSLSPIISAHDGRS